MKVRLAGVTCASVGLALALVALAPQAGATATSSTDPTVLTGESGSFSFPLVTNLLNDATASIAPENAGDIDFDVDRARDDFATLNDDFAVSEYPLSVSDQTTAQTNGRSYAYVPFAAVPVDIGLDLLATNAETASSYATSSFLQDIQFTPAQLMFLFTAVGNGDHNWNSNPYLALTSASSAAQCAQDQLLPICTALPVAVSGQSTNGLIINPILPKVASATVTSLENYFANSPTTMSTWTTWLGEQPNAQTSDELWPVDVGTQNDQAVLHALIPFTALSNGNPVTTIGGGFIADNGSVAPLPSDWIYPASALGGFQVPTAKLQNAVGDFVAGNPASAQAALSYASIDPATNLVTFPTDDPNPAAYPLVDMSYLIVPTSGLTPAKDTAMGKLIQFILGSGGAADIEQAGAAPITQAADPRLYAADESIATQLLARASAPATATTATTTASSTAATTTSQPATTTTVATTTTTSTTAPGTVTAATAPPDAIPHGFTAAASGIVDATGGTIETGDASTRVIVEVPAGEFSSSTQVTVSDGPIASIKVPTGDKAIASVAVAFDQEGTALNAKFARPIPVAIESLGVTSGAKLLVYNGTTKAYAAAPAGSPISDISSAQGAVSFDLTGDPEFAVVEPAAVPPAKTPSKSRTTGPRSTTPTSPPVPVTNPPSSGSQPSTSPPQLAFTGASPLPLLVIAGMVTIGAEVVRRRALKRTRARLTNESVSGR